LARWAPSGDNESPWRFEIIDQHHLVVHARDTRDWCIYDLDGTSSQIAVGALLENIAIAASGEGLTADYQLRPDSPDTAPVIDVWLQPGEGAAPDPRLNFITSRVTQRRPFTTRELSGEQKMAMEAAVGDGYRVHWIEGAGNRWKMAKLLFHNAHIRLTTPEAYEVHRKNIEWGARFSEDRLPEYAVGVGFPVRQMMHWALGSWQRVKFLNRFFAGTWAPRLQMDLLAGYRCGAHFVIVADTPLASVDDYLRGGRAMQRFWLEATQQGLQFQPEMTPLIFSRYVANELHFTSVASEERLAAKLALELGEIVGDGDAGKRVYMGRVGFGPRPESRSIRPPLQTLLIDEH
jgi:hypothetical protein